MGIVFILWKKIPILVQLPQNGSHGLRKPVFVLKIENTIKDFHFDFFKKQIWFHKLLSRTMIIILKLERMIGDLLCGVRKKIQELDKEARKR